MILRKHLAVSNQPAEPQGRRERKRNWKHAQIFFASGAYFCGRFLAECRFLNADCFPGTSFLLKVSNTLARKTKAVRQQAAIVHVKEPNHVHDIWSAQRSLDRYECNAVDRRFAGVADHLHGCVAGASLWGEDRNSSAIYGELGGPAG